MSRAAMPTAAEIFGPDQAIPRVTGTVRGGEQLVGEHLTEARLAERFAEAYGLDLRHNHARGAWVYYADPIWRSDTDGLVYRLALKFVRAQQVDALAIPDRKAKEEHLQFALKAESKAALDRLIGLAKNLKPLADAGTGWDTSVWHLGAPNGIIDLKSGEVRAGDPADRITMSVAVAYDPVASAPRWHRFLEEVFNGDPELIDFVHRFTGYALTGLTTEQVLAVFYGRGANGKTTFINAISHVLGDYSHNMPFSTVELKQRASIPNDVAALEGKRFVTASETNDGVRLNESRIKALTGCDRISARFMHSEWFSFRPVAKFVLAVNHKPMVRDDSPGFWRRIHLIPFTQCFTGSRRDDGLENELCREAPGILRWAVEGCLAWQQHGLTPPGVVTAATNDYQEDSDPLAQFLEQSCEPDPEGRVKASELHECYAKWADRERLAKYERLSSKDFGRRVAERFVRRKTMSGWVYEGLRIITSRLW